MNSNRDDPFASADACFKMQRATQDLPIKKEIDAVLNNLYGKIIPKINDELAASGISENLEVLHQLFKEHMSNMAAEYNYTSK
jgi:hypothetical protein